MSFTIKVKNEILKIKLTEKQKINFLFAILLLNKSDKIILKSENIAIARFIYSLINQIFKINPKIIVRKGYNYRNKMLYIIEINNKDIIENMYNKLKLNQELKSPKELDDETVKAYLTSIFLICGSINDPSTSNYHLEFVVNDKFLANYISLLLNKFYLNSKVLKRENKYMIYIKESEKISDFLKIMNTVHSLLYFEDIRIYRDNVNMTNRINNCEQANIDKIIATCAKQLDDIELIKKYSALELLDENVKVVANYRIKYPETSLQELSEIISLETGKKITKSGVYHRLNKIEELANKIRKN